MSLVTYWHTLRYLRPVQIYGRVWFKLYRPRPNQEAQPVLRTITGNWTAPAAKKSGMVAPSEFRFLNQSYVLDFPGCWNNPVREKLWLYNLHYFDDLNARQAGQREEWLRDLIQRWIDDNPPASGNGWEPYPLSLRIVNWVKWALAGNYLEKSWQHSLMVQARHLVKRLEWHLLGNHLFVNAKALVFAGIFFSGAEADRWLNKGLKVLDRELEEQILADGGHFERSPMYHSIILEDLLDLHNIFSIYFEALPQQWSTLPEKVRAAIAQMRIWLASMVHPDGEIALFNDAAFGISPAPSELDAYAVRLGFGELQPGQDGVVQLPETGYVRCQVNDAVLMLDVGEIGPDYIPGHAHADTLSFEMSLYGRRLIVDSGTSCYGLSKERLRQRSTEAHNTVTIDHQNSSEVWGGFRVARRARPRDLLIEDNNCEIRVSCAHDGYCRLPTRPIHRREWRLKDRSLVILDSIEGSFTEAVARFHLHPQVTAEMSDGGREGRLHLSGGKTVTWRLTGGNAEIVQSTYHPEFGVSLPSQCLKVLINRSETEFILAWQDDT